MDISKFSVAEMFSDSSNGKTSIGKVAGSYLIALASLMLLSGTIAVFFTGLELSRLNLLFYTAAGAITAGSGLIMGKILKPTKEKDLKNEIKVTEEVSI